jgi:hypothetical protein
LEDRLTFHARKRRPENKVTAIWTTGEPRPPEGFGDGVCRNGHRLPRLRDDPGVRDWTCNVCGTQAHMSEVFSYCEECDYRECSRCCPEVLKAQRAGYNGDSWTEVRYCMWHFEYLRSVADGLIECILVAGFEASPRLAPDLPPARGYPTRIPASPRLANDLGLRIMGFWQGWIRAEMIGGFNLGKRFMTAMINANQAAIQEARGNRHAELARAEQDRRIPLGETMTPKKTW